MYLDTFSINSYAIVIEIFMYKVKTVSDFNDIPNIFQHLAFIILSVCGLCFLITNLHELTLKLQSRDVFNYDIFTSSHFYFTSLYLFQRFYSYFVLSYIATFEREA